MRQREWRGNKKESLGKVTEEQIERKVRMAKRNELKCVSDRLGSISQGTRNRYRIDQKNT